MKRVFLSLCGICLALTLSSVEATAQSSCTNDNKSSLLSCASNSILACRNLFPSCKEPAQALSVQDVLNETSARCCSITGSRRVQRQRACIGAVQNRYLRAQVGADRTLKPFLRETRRQLQVFRRAGCTTGST
jgi:hypothetical protein